MVELFIKGHRQCFISFTMEPELHVFYSFKLGIIKCDHGKNEMS